MRSVHSGTVRRSLKLAALCLALGAPLTASAQTDEQRAGARSLATEGATAFNEGRYKEAVDLFSRAESLLHAPPHLLFLARSHEKLGQLVKAREAYLKVVREPLPPNAPQAFRDAQVAADQEVRAIEPRIASLTIKIQGGETAQDLSVSVDGTALPAALVGVSRPVDPGEHKVEAVATGFRAEAQTVRLADGERKTLLLALISDPNAVSPTAAPAAGAPSGLSAPLAADGSISGSSTPTQDTGSSGTNGLRIGSYVAFGVGVVGLGVGTVFLLDSRAKRSDADAAYEECNASGDCRENDPAARETDDLDQKAKSALTLSIVGFSVGAVGIAAGTALFLMSGKPRTEEPPLSGLSVRPFIGYREAGLYGRF